MSLLKYMKQGGVIVARDETGKVVKATPIKQEIVKTKRSWRAQLRAMDVTGIDDLIALKNIAHGIPQRREFPDGSFSEYQVPSFGEQRQALTTLIEIRFGKAVAQTEVVAAEKEAEDNEQYNAISDAALYEAAQPWLERIAKKKEELIDSTNTEESDE